MPEISPIENSLIDNVIKANQPGPQNPAKTSGQELRALIKLLRDRFEQENAKSASGVLYYGSVDPGAALGNDGDIYLKSGGYFYQKSAGTWILRGQLQSFQSMQVTNSLNFTPVVPGKGIHYLIDSTNGILHLNLYPSSTAQDYNNDILRYIVNDSQIQLRWDLRTKSLTFDVLPVDTVSNSYKILVVETDGSTRLLDASGLIVTTGDAPQQNGTDAFSTGGAYALNEAIDNEIARATNAENSIQNNVDAAQSDINSEASRAIAAESSLSSAITAVYTDLRAGVATDGDTFQKLYNLIQLRAKQYSAADIAGRNALNVTIGSYVFVEDDGDGNWALYRSTTAGTGAAYIKISDPDVLNAVMTSAQIRTSYLSNSGTEEFTTTLLNKLNAITGTNTGDETPASIKAKMTSVTTDDISAEGTANKWWTNARTIGSLLTGYVKSATNRAVAATDTILIAIGILEKQIEGKQDTLMFDSVPTTSSTNPATSGGIKTAIDAEATARTTAVSNEAATRAAADALLASQIADISAPSIGSDLYNFYNFQ